MNGLLSNKRKFAGAAMILLMGTTVRAELIVSHFGSNDPVTEGWTLIGPAGEPTNNGGTFAWRINDTSTVTPLRYIIDPVVFTSTQAAYAASGNWHMSWQLNIVTTNLDPVNRAVELSLGLLGTVPGAPRYLMQFGRNGNDARLRLADNAGDGGAKTFTLTNFGSGFHTWDLYAIPGGNFVSLYVDNTLVTSNWNGQADTEQHLYFGSVSGSATGESQWAYLYLEVPEPNTLVLLAVTWVGLVTVRRRKR